MSYCAFDDVLYLEFVNFFVFKPDSTNAFIPAAELLEAAREDVGDLEIEEEVEE